jgi:hypothetical protein
MRKTIFWLGWVILGLLPVAALVEIYLRQDAPVLVPWKLALAPVAVLLIFFARNRDDVLKHRIV